jgi:hypothetical protein
VTAGLACWLAFVLLIGLVLIAAIGHEKSRK